MTKARCPICGAGMDRRPPSEWPEWPFCRPRCKLIDLGRWLGEDYCVPSSAAQPDQDSADDSES